MSATASAPAALFRYEARRDGKVVAALEASRNTDGGIVVETTVTPVGKKATPIARPFAFSQADAARRFADETLLALEYLGCDIS